MEGSRGRRLSDQGVAEGEDGDQGLLVDVGPQPQHQLQVLTVREAVHVPRLEPRPQWRVQRAAHVARDGQPERVHQAPLLHLVHVVLGQQRVVTCRRDEQPPEPLQHLVQTRQGQPPHGDG